MELNQYVYSPAIRATVYNLNALDTLYDDVKDLIIPRVILRDKEALIDNFLSKWGQERPLLLEVSKYTLDSDEEIIQQLSDPTNDFNNQYEFFDTRKIYNIIPVINEVYSVSNLRPSIQLTIKLVNIFNLIGFKLDIKNNFSASYQLLQILLATLNDDQIQKIILIVDAEKIETLSDISQQNLQQAMRLISSYKIRMTIFSSTSYPSSRPNSGSNQNHECLDPIWQYICINKLQSMGLFSIYGDNGATDPSLEKVDFDFAVRPIPFATYLLKDILEWYLIRDGKGGEYEKFRDIASDIRVHPNYHGDNFCYANEEIKDIANGTRAKAGNQAFWNKLKINQHISAIINAYHNNMLDITQHHSDEDEED